MLIVLAQCGAQSASGELIGNLVSISRLALRGATHARTHTRGGRDTILVIFGGKLRSCEKSAGPVNCSIHRT